jgi:hypothetical protein
MNAPQRPQQGSLWVPVKDITDEATGLTVRITKRDGFRAQFSTELLRRQETNGQVRFVRHIGIFSTTSNSRVAVTRVRLVVATIFEQAEDWIHNELQIREDEILEEKLSREQAQLSRDKPKQRPGLKALAKQDKAAKEAQKPKEEPSVG